MFEPARALRDLGKLVCHPSQIARENLYSLCTAMKLSADAVELVFDVDRLAAGFVFNEARPDRLRRWFRAGEHALDWTEEGEFGGPQLAARREHGGLPDVAEKH